MDTTIYYFDRIWIYTMQNPTTIKSKLPLAELNSCCRIMSIKGKSAFSEFTNYHSMIDVIAPTPEFLTILYENEKAFLPYKISYLELAKDHIFPTKQEAIQACSNLNFRKKYASKNFNFFNPELPTDNEMFGNVTKYSKSKNFQIRAYPRISKIAGEPCSHVEWIIKTPSIIKLKTGIIEVGDLLAFNFQHFFENQDKRMLIHNERIDQHKLGKWILNLGNKKTFSKRKLMSIGCHGGAYSNYRTYGELINYFQQWKKDIKMKTGPKTELEKRVLNLKDYSIFRKL